MAASTGGSLRKGFTVSDLAGIVCCLLVVASLVICVSGANRDLSRSQVCANNLRQLFTGLTLYVNQYNSYPPHAPWPLYAPSAVGNGWDPNMGWLLTYGLGIEPPSKVTQGTGIGHFIWYMTPFDELPDVCKCPAMPAELMDLDNPEISDPSQGEPVPLESVFYEYALSYQTSGTCRAACPVTRARQGGTFGDGGRNPPIPDPSGGNASAQPWGNTQRNGPPGVYAVKHDPARPPEDPSYSSEEPNCWIQAVHPAEVQSPGRVYYLADSRDYRPQAPGQNYDWPPAGYNAGWYVGWGNKEMLGTRHFEYANVLYLDGRASRAGQTHMPQWNMAYDPSQPAAPGSSQWRSSTFATVVRPANLQTQVHVMPVLMVRGWEYFFEANGLLAK